MAVRRPPPLGQIAIEWGLLTPESLAEAVDRQRRLASQGKHQQLGEILVESGYLSSDQVEELLLAQDLATTRSQERLFGTVAVDAGYISAEQLREALAEQSVAWRFGRKRPLVGEVLIDKGWLSDDQVLDILEAQARGQGRAPGPATDSPGGRADLPPPVPGEGRRWAPFGLTVDDLIRLGRESGLHRHAPGLKLSGRDGGPRPPARGGSPSVDHAGHEREGDDRGRVVPLSSILDAGPLPPRRALEVAGRCARLLAIRRRDGGSVGRPVPQAILVEPGPPLMVVSVDPSSSDGRAPPTEEHLARSIGSLLYECLTGVPAGGRNGVIPARLLRPSHIREDIHPEVEALCLRALRGRRGGFGSPGRLADAIDRFLDGRRTRPPGRLERLVARFRRTAWT